MRRIELTESEAETLQVILAVVSLRPPNGDSRHGEIDVMRNRMKGEELFINDSTRLKLPRRIAVKDWNVVASVHEERFSGGRRLLEQFGQAEKTGFFNILVMWATHPVGLLQSLEELARRDRPSSRWHGLIRSPTPSPFSPLMSSKRRLRGCARMGPRPRRRKLSRPHAPARLQGEAVEHGRRAFPRPVSAGRTGTTGSPGRITFDDPDAIIAVETVGVQAGLSLWTREDLRRYPLLHLD